MRKKEVVRERKTLKKEKNIFEESKDSTTSGHVENRTLERKNLKSKMIERSKMWKKMRKTQMKNKKNKR